MPENDAALQFAYKKGRTAYQHGKSLAANPYEPNSSYFKKWREGWEAEASVRKPEVSPN